MGTLSQILSACCKLRLPDTNSTDSWQWSSHFQAQRGITASRPGDILPWFPEQRVTPGPSRQPTAHTWSCSGGNFHCSGLAALMKVLTARSFPEEPMGERYVQMEHVESRHGLTGVLGYCYYYSIAQDFIQKTSTIGYQAKHHIHWHKRQLC